MKDLIGHYSSTLSNDKDVNLIEKCTADAEKMKQQQITPSNQQAYNHQM